MSVSSILREPEPADTPRSSPAFAVGGTTPRRPASDASAAYRANAALAKPQAVTPPVIIDAGLGQGARRARNIQRGLTALIVVELAGLLVAAVWLIGSQL